MGNEQSTQKGVTQNGKVPEKHENGSANGVTANITSTGIEINVNTETKFNQRNEAFNLDLATESTEPDFVVVDSEPAEAQVVPEIIEAVVKVVEARRSKSAFGKMFKKKPEPPAEVVKVEQPEKSNEDVTDQSPAAADPEPELNPFGEEEAAVVIVTRNQEEVEPPGTADTSTQTDAKVEVDIATQTDEDEDTTAMSPEDPADDTVVIESVTTGESLDQCVVIAEEAVEEEASDYPTCGIIGEEVLLMEDDEFENITFRADLVEVIEIGPCSAEDESFNAPEETELEIATEPESDPNRSVTERKKMKLLDEAITEENAEEAGDVSAGVELIGTPEPQEENGAPSLYEEILTAAVAPETSDQDKPSPVIDDEASEKCGEEEITTVEVSPSELIPTEELPEDETPEIINAEISEGPETVDESEPSPAVVPGGDEVIPEAAIDLLARQFVVTVTIHQEPAAHHENLVEEEVIPEAAIDLLAQLFAVTVTSPQEPEADHENLVEEEVITATVFKPLSAEHELNEEAIEALSNELDAVPESPEEETAVQESATEEEIAGFNASEEPEAESNVEEEKPDVPEDVPAQTENIQTPELLLLTSEEPAEEEPRACEEDATTEVLEKTLEAVVEAVLEKLEVTEKIVEEIVEVLAQNESTESPEQIISISEKPAQENPRPSEEDATTQMLENTLESVVEAVSELLEVREKLVQESEEVLAQTESIGTSEQIPLISVEPTEADLEKLEVTEKVVQESEDVLAQTESIETPEQILLISLEPTEAVLEKHEVTENIVEEPEDVSVTPVEAPEESEPSYSVHEEEEEKVVIDEEAPPAGADLSESPAKPEVLVVISDTTEDEVAQEIIPESATEEEIAVFNASEEPEAESNVEEEKPDVPEDVTSQTESIETPEQILLISLEPTEAVLEKHEVTENIVEEPEDVSVTPVEATEESEPSYSVHEEEEEKVVIDEEAPPEKTVEEIVDVLAQNESTEIPEQCISISEEPAQENQTNNSAEVPVEKEAVAECVEAVLETIEEELIEEEATETSEEVAPESDSTESSADSQSAEARDGLDLDALREKLQSACESVVESSTYSLGGLEILTQGNSFTISIHETATADLTPEAQSPPEPDCGVSADAGPEEDNPPETDASQAEESDPDDNPVMNFFKTLVTPTKTSKKETATPEAAKDQSQQETHPAAATTTAQSHRRWKSGEKQLPNLRKPTPKDEPKAAAKQPEPSKGKAAKSAFGKFFRPKTVPDTPPAAVHVELQPGVEEQETPEEAAEAGVEVQSENKVEDQEKAEEVEQPVVEEQVVDGEPESVEEAEKVDPSKAGTLEAAAKPEPPPPVQEEKKKTGSKSPFLSFFKPKAEPKKDPPAPAAAAAEAAQTVKAKEEPKAAAKSAEVVVENKQASVPAADEAANAPKKLEKRNSIGHFFKGFGVKRHSTDAGVQAEPAVAAAAEKTK
ncbi:unnamed protein product [Pleuronectes platessa]|uniref:Uncharacterized protein n=1 Tax=Pleuronectes platessa TaxID=8262 RepID=A0A9N7Y6A0_PLEPL|nr:unnamed protein product [Pleuronectes platessa]